MRSALKCDARHRNIFTGTPDAVQSKVSRLPSPPGRPRTSSRRIALPELRKDPITGRWVIISTERGKRPNDFLRESVIPREEKNCPFCVGNEARTPPEILVYGRNGGGPNTPGWSIRVVPNKFPALGIEGELDRDTGERVIGENEHFITLAPYAPRFPFEMWLLPKVHGSSYENNQSSIYASLARMLKDTLMRLDQVLDRPALNFMIHTSPIGEETNDHYHWHIEIIPKLTKVAGFEWGTGFYINPTPPEESARFLREAKLPAIAEKK